MTKILVDELCPLTVQSERFALQVVEPDSPVALQPVVVSVDYARATDTYTDATGNAFPGGGVSLPLELRVTGPGQTRSRVFRLFAPDEVSFVPDRAGDWTVAIRESAHNLYWGAVTVSVAGDNITEGT